MTSYLGASLIGLWWFGNFLLNILSKRVLAKDGEESITYEGLTTDSLKLEWIEITSLHLITASVVSVALVKATGGSLWPSEALEQKGIVFTIAIGHLLGTLASNAAYTLVDSDFALIVRASLPLCTMLLTTSRVACIDFSKFLSVTFIVLGVIVFQIGSLTLTLNWWGLFAAIVSTLAFTFRNVYYKEASKQWDSVFEKFMVTSVLSAFLSIPLWWVKLEVTKTILTKNILGVRGVLSCIIHPALSLTSFRILEMVTPVTHAIMTDTLGIFSSFESIYRVLPINANWIIVLAIFAIIVGLWLYIRNTQRTRISLLLLKIFFLFAIVGGMVLLRPGGYVADDAPPNARFLSMSVLRQQQSQVKSISTAWLYDTNITSKAITNIGHLADHNPSFNVYVYCGTTQCAREISHLNKRNIVVGYAVISDIVKETPLEEWVVRHPINKLIAGLEFENHLHQVSIIGILWHYGGFYVSPMVRISKGNLPEQKKNSMVALISKAVPVPKGSVPSVFDVSYFSRNHPVLKSLAEAYASKYPTIDDLSFKFDFMEAVWDSTLSQCQGSHCLYQIFDGEMKVVREDMNWTNHYGLLSRSNVSVHHSSNYLNDEMENLAGLQYLPYVDSLIWRDNIQSSAHYNVTAFLNSRWEVPGGNQIPPNTLNPVMLSVRLNTGMKRDCSYHLNYLQTAGCRDVRTLSYLQNNGADTFSSSLMLLVKNPNFGQPNRRYIYFADLRQDYVDLLPREVLAKARNLKDMSTPAGNGTLALAKTAYRIMEKLGSAKLVITENIEYALACVAMESPVIYINSDNKAPISNTIRSLVVVVDMYAMTSNQAREWLQNFSLKYIPPDPNPAMLMRLRATSWNVIRRNEHLYDAAVRFGVVPMSPPASLQHQSRPTFYLIFSTSKTTVIKMYGSSKTHSGQFNWRHWRSIESVFYHHPTAQVKVYSNTLADDTFSVLTEAGYSIQVVRYRLEDLLVGTPAEGFIKKLKRARKGAFWYSHVSDLLRTLLLYHHGGYYMDTDIIIVRPLDSLRTNTLGWENSYKGLLNGAFMKFEKGNVFLNECLNDFVKNYRGDLWAQNGPRLFTRVYRTSTWSNSEINLVDHKVFYMFKGSDMNEYCFSDTEGSVFEDHVRTLNNTAYVVHTNSKISGYKGIEGDHLKNGTLCKHLLNSYCVLCDQIH